MWLRRWWPRSFPPFETQAATSTEVTEDRGPCPAGLKGAPGGDVVAEPVSVTPIQRHEARVSGTLTLPDQRSQ